MPQSKPVPQLNPIGNLKTVVREGGHNNDDGDGWSVLADDELKPPAHLPRGLFSVVLSFISRR